MPAIPPELNRTLIERAQTGDAEALELVLRAVAPSVHRFARRMCRDKDEAEDALQDTLLAVAGHLGEFEGRSSLLSWVFTLARTACSRRRRGLKNQPMESDADVAEQPAPSRTPEESAAD